MPSKKRWIATTCLILLTLLTGCQSTPTDETIRVQYWVIDGEVLKSGSERKTIPEAQKFLCKSPEDEAELLKACHKATEK